MEEQVDEKSEHKSFILQLSLHYDLIFLANETHFRLNLIPCCANL